MKYVLTAMMVVAMLLGAWAQFVGASELRQACTDVFILSAVLGTSLRIGKIEEQLRALGMKGRK